MGNIVICICPCFTIAQAYNLSSAYDLKTQNYWYWLNIY